MFIPGSHMRRPKIVRRLVWRSGVVRNTVPKYGGGGPKLGFRAIRSQVLKRTMTRTGGHLKAKDLKRNRLGVVVSRNLSEKRKNHPVIMAMMAARKALKIKGMMPLRKGTALYKKTKQLFLLMKH